MLMKRKENYAFLNEWQLGMRSGMFTIMYCANGFGPEVMIRRQQLQKQNSSSRNACSEFDGIESVWCFLSSNQGMV